MRKQDLKEDKKLLTPLAHMKAKFGNENCLGDTGVSLEKCLRNHFRSDQRGWE